MLRRLEIKDLALIESAVLEPGPGLTILTGETGAGKSLLIGAIKGMTGARMGREWVREGAEEATLDAVWDDVDRAIPIELLSQIRAADDMEDDLYLGRTISAVGRSMTRVDGRLAPLSQLKEIGAHLADIHGQHDTQAIFKTDAHLSLLDRYGGTRIAPFVTAYQESYAEYRQLLQKEKEMVADPEARARILDQLRYQTNELLMAELKVGEEETLQSEALRLSQIDRYRGYLEAARHATEGADEFVGEGVETGVLPSIAIAEQAMLDATKISPELDALATRVSVLKNDAEDILGDIVRVLDQAEGDPDRLEWVEQRLDQLGRLKRKYGGTIERMLAYLEKAQLKLDKLVHAEDELAKLVKKRTDILARISTDGEKLSHTRREVALDLSERVQIELNHLGMKDATFSVAFNPFEDDRPHPEGLDQVEFLLSANRGESPKPLARIASGGEAARIILAIKVILADADPIPLLVFDEVDTGVSGGTSSMIGKMLKRLGQTHQVLCVTHSAQIAALANTHILIDKVSEDGRTRTRLTPLKDDARVNEIARILSGEKVTAEARRQAQNLLHESGL